MTRRLLMLLAAAPLLLAAGDPSQFTADVPDPAEIVGAPVGRPIPEAELEKATEELSKLLRCPVCQGSSIADSPSEMARNMKKQVGVMLAAGYTHEQIIGYFEFSYGEFVRLEPTRDGMNLVVWFAPAFGLMLGLGILFSVARKLRGDGGEDASAAEASQDEAVDPELAPYVEQVRALVAARLES